MRIDILKQGDEFVGIFGNMIAIRKASGEVELTAVILDEHNCIRLEEGPKIIIGYGDNTVEATSEDGKVTVVTF